MCGLKSRLRDSTFWNLVEVLNSSSASNSGWLETRIRKAAMPSNSTKLEATSEALIAESLFFGLLSLVILVGNTLVCTAIYKTRKLRTKTNYYLVSLAVADIMVGVFFCPLLDLLQVSQSWRKYSGLQSVHHIRHPVRHSVHHKSCDDKPGTMYFSHGACYSSKLIAKNDFFDNSCRLDLRPYCRVRQSREWILP